MRILMIGPVNSPHMEDLAVAMAQRGHTVQAGGALWGGGLAPSSLPAAGIPVSVVTWPQVLWMRRLLREFRPDVVHANWMGFAAVAVLARARPMVAMPWGSDVYLATGWRRRLNRLVARRADLVLADSTALVDEMVELGASRQRTAVVQWGVDLDTFRPPASSDEKRALRESLGLQDGPVVISARGLKPLYSPGVVVEAFTRIVRELPEAQLILKYDGGDSGMIESLALPERVQIVGRVPYARIADYYRAADVCVSIPSTDSSPRSVWEAMACGCACVVSDLPWVYEQITPDVDALVVAVDAAAVTHAIKHLVTEPELGRSLAEHARELVEQKHDRTKEMDRLDDLYRRVAGRPA